MFGIVLNGALMTNEELMHDVLMEKLQLPHYYGRNLDALWDILTERTEAILVTLLNPELMPYEIQRGLTALFLDYGRINSNFKLEICSDAIKLGRYRHFKGGEYKVIALALDSETLEPVTVYNALYGSGGVWVRPARMWRETVNVNSEMKPRFEYIGSDVD